MPPCALRPASPSSARPRASAASPAPSWSARCTDCTKRVRPGPGGDPPRGTLPRDLLSGLASPFPPPPRAAFPGPGARSPYSQIPNLAGRTPPEDRMRPRAPRPDVRLPKSCHSSRHKLAPTRRSLSPGESRGRRRGWGGAGAGQAKSGSRTPGNREEAGEVIWDHAGA